MVAFLTAIFSYIKILKWGYRHSAEDILNSFIPFISCTVPTKLQIRQISTFLRRTTHTLIVENVAGNSCRESRNLNRVILVLKVAGVNVAR